MDQVIAEGTRLEQQNELPRMRHLARPPRPLTALAVAPPVGQAAIQAAYVRKQHLAAYHILPELIDGLTEYITIWRSSTAPVTNRCGTPESFSMFLTAVSLLNATVFLKPQFWSGVSNGRAQWTAAPRDENGAAVDSPYFPAHGLQPSQRGAPSGSNTWLDRFLHARSRFRNANDRVVFNPYFMAATQDNEPHPQRIPQLHEFPQQLVADLTTLKFEFAALFALCCCPLTLPVHDFSLDGRDRDSKWFAAGGGFRLWTSQTAHEHLSDPQNLRDKLRSVSELRFVGRTLADLPGAFPDVEARINITIARMRKKQIEALALTISDSQTSPFRDFHERHPDLDDAFYKTIARLRDSTRSAYQDPVRVNRSDEARDAEMTKHLAHLALYKPYQTYQGPLNQGVAAQAGMVQRKYAQRWADLKRRAMPDTGRLELLDNDQQTRERHAREDSRLRDNLDADEDAVQAVMRYTAPNAAGISQEQIDDAVNTIVAQPGVPGSAEEYPLEAGASSRAAGASARAAGSSTRRYPPDQVARHRQRMAAATVADVRNFNSNNINVALDVRGIKIPQGLGLGVEQRRHLLLALLSGETVAEVIQAFADQGVPLMHMPDGQWLVYQRHKSYK
jgi:hypothetical protein